MNKIEELTFVCANCGAEEEWNDIPEGWRASQYWDVSDFFAYAQETGYAHFDGLCPECAKKCRFCRRCGLSSPKSEMDRLVDIGVFEDGWVCRPCLERMQR